MQSNILNSFFVCLMALAMPLALGTGCSEAEDRVSSACELMTTGQASDIFGVPFDLADEMQHQEDGDRFFSLCNYTSSSEPMASIAVTVMYGPAFEDPKAAAENHVASFREGLGMPDYEFEDVGGVGDVALLDVEMKQLTVFDKGRMLLFQAYGNTGVREKLLGMATAVLSR